MNGTVLLGLAGQSTDGLFQHIDVLLRLGQHLTLRGRRAQLTQYLSTVKKTMLDPLSTLYVMHSELPSKDAGSLICL